MSLIELLPYLSALTYVSVAVVCAVGVLAALALIGLRFVRRGPSRFWLAPAFATLSCLPVVAGAGLAALGVVGVARAGTLVGSFGRVAIRAGLVESSVPLLLGAALTGAVGTLALLLLALGRSGESGPAGPSSSSLGPRMSLALVACALAMALGVPAVGHVLASGSFGVTRLAQALAFAWAGLAVVMLVVAFPMALGSPRGAAPPHWRSLSLGALGGLVACALVLALAGSAWALRPLSGDAVRRTDAGALPEVASPVPTLAAPPEAAAGEPVRVGGAIREPRKLRNFPPEYPALARQARLQGAVILECVIGTEGRVTSVKVLRGAPLLAEAATTAVRQWEYEPTRLNGVAVPVIMTVTVNFTLS